MNSEEHAVSSEEHGVLDSPRSSSPNDADESSETVTRQPSPQFVRSRKLVKRTPIDGWKTRSSKPKEFAGHGMRLGDISKIAHNVDKAHAKNEGLKLLHRVLLGSDGTTSTRKKNIRNWNGTSVGEVLAGIRKRLSAIKTVKLLKEIGGILGISGSGEREVVEKRMSEFLMNPNGSDAPLKKKKSPKKSRKSSTSSSPKVTRVVEGPTSSFSVFLKKRAPEVTALGGMTAQNVTEILALEWASMDDSERAQYHVKPAHTGVKKVISKKPVTRDSSSSSSSGESSSDSDDSSSSSDSSEDDSN